MNTRLSLVLAVASAALVTSAANAQFPVTSGNASWNQTTTVFPGGALGIWDTSPTNAGFASSLIPDTGGANWMPRNGWLYGTPRTPGFTTTLSDFGTVLNLANGAQITGSGNSRQIRINNIVPSNAGEAVDGVWSYTLTDGATPNNATLTASVKFINRLATGAKIRIGAYTDLNVGGDLANDRILSQGTRAFLWDSVSGLGAFADAPGAKAFQYGETAAVAQGLVQATLSNTPAAGGSISLNDAAVAFYWDIDVPAGVGAESAVISYTIGLSSVPTPGSLAILGLGGMVAARRRRA